MFPMYYLAQGILSQLHIHLTYPITIPTASCLQDSLIPNRETHTVHMLDSKFKVEKAINL